MLDDTTRQLIKDIYIYIYIYKILPKQIQQNLCGCSSLISAAAGMVRQPLQHLQLHLYSKNNK